MLDEYRQRFRAFHTHWQREQFLFRAGRKTRAEWVHLYQENSDLFSTSALAELQAQHAEVAAYRVTERQAIERLLAFARSGQIASRSLELTEELVAYEARPTIQWNGESLTIQQAQLEIAREAAPPRRHELAARRAEALHHTQDLRAERFARWQAGAQTFGYDHWLALAVATKQVELPKLAEQAAQLLAKTETPYVAALKPLLAREAHVGLEEATQADLGYLQRLARFAPYFPVSRAIELYADLFAGLGFKVEQQPQIELDTATRPDKQARAFCAPVQIPDEIKLVLNLDHGHDGYGFYQDFLQASGRAQLAAWTSREMHYEFRVPGDPAVGEAWGMLFSQLLLEAEFLLGNFGFPASGEFRHALAVFKLLHVRRATALLQYETEFHAGKLSRHAGARFAELLTDGVRVRYDEAECLRAIETPFRSADRLRAWAFEAQLREHLRTRFGTRWWATRQAGEMLIDLWNTGQRYTVEELAGQIGLGELDFAWFGAELVNTLAS
ncbi:MAG: hypothetical protein HYR56_17655 [Acidobacteria bacterium]|nr:hypothetical protein [Acidobacteriota bacterium]MBI3426533.1 hypothetical protein [Acidobacteriota bacterium]